MQNGDIVLIKAGTRMARTDYFDRLAVGLGARGFGDCVLIVVDSIENDLGSLSAEQMNGLGWFKKHTVDNATIEGEINEDITADS